MRESGRITLYQSLPLRAAAVLLIEIFTAPAYTEAAFPASATNSVTVDATLIITKIPSSEFWHHAVWWMGPVAGDVKFLNPIANLHSHIFRFPGGSSIDVYFCNAEQGVNPANALLLIMDEKQSKEGTRL